MAQALTGLLPEQLFQPDKTQEVIAFLQAQPAPSNVRREWFYLWALWVGQIVNRSEYARVQRGAVDL